MQNMRVRFLLSSVQEKLANFFYNSSMDDRFLKFDILTNELDVLRNKIYQVKEQSKFKNYLKVEELINPKTIKTSTNSTNNTNKTTNKKIIGNPRKGSVVVPAKKSNSVKKTTANTTASSKNTVKNETKNNKLNKSTIKGFNSVNFN